jgi:hypothetical protein
MIKNIRDLYRGIIDFEKGYQARNNIVQDGKCYLVTYSHSIMAKWRNNFSWLLNVHELMMNGRQKYIQQSHWGLSRVPLRLS